MRNWFVTTDGLMNSISRQTTSFFDMPQEMADNLPQSRDFHLPKIIFFQGQFTDEISFFGRLEPRSNANCPKRPQFS